MSNNQTDENILALFLYAYNSNPVEPGIFNAYTKAEVRAYRQAVIEQCQEQTGNPVARDVLKAMHKFPLVELANIMMNMRRIRSDILEKYTVVDGQVVQRVLKESEAE